jgi:methionine biosynthesis protein MetW
MTEPIRLDHKIIADIIPTGAHVLDLGCGDGSLLALLKTSKSVTGSGVEIDEEAIYQCVAKGLSVSHGDIDSNLADYGDKSFDYVILNESLQQVLSPQKVILESLRIGKKAIVSIPNFCHITGRLQVFFAGRVPITKELPYQWYDTPNLRFLSIKDFRSFCTVSTIAIEKEKAIAYNREIYFLPNLFAHMGLFVLTKS